MTSTARRSRADHLSQAFAAFPGAKWDSAAYCGACVRVKGPKGTVDVQITNKVSLALLRGQRQRLTTFAVP